MNNAAELAYIYAFASFYQKQIDHIDAKPFNELSYVVTKDEKLTDYHKKNIEKVNFYMTAAFHALSSRKNTTFTFKHGKDT